MEINAKKGDLIWNYLGVLISLGSNFVQLPLLIFFLDEATLGLWYVFLSVGGIVQLFDFGFNATLSRNVAYCWSGATTLKKECVVYINDSDSKPNILLMKKVLKICKFIYLIISICALVILIFVGTPYILYVSSEFSSYDHIIAWFIFCFAIFFNLYFGYFVTFLRGVGAVKEINVAGIVSKLFQLVLSVVLLIAGFKLLAIAISYLITNIVYRVVSNRLFYSYKNIGTLLKKSTIRINIYAIKELFGIIWHNAWKDGLVSISNFISNQSSVLICSIYFGLEVTGVYSISVQLINAIATISGALYSAYQPSLQSACVGNNLAKSRQIMSFVMTAFVLFFGIGFVGLCVVGVPLLGLVKPEATISMSLLFGVAIHRFLLMHHSLYASYISNTNNIPYMKSYLISSFTEIVLVLILLKFTNGGVGTLIFVQIFVQAVYNNWIWPYKVMQQLNTNPIGMLKSGINTVRDGFKIWNR